MSQADPAPSIRPVGASEMARRIRAHDWAATPLGPLVGWPEALRTVVDLVVATGFPSVVLWGEDLIQVYNDGYRDLMGTKHPAGLGQPTSSCWPEVWDINRPIYERVWAGETLSFEDRLYPITRNGGPEDAWFTLSYAPLRGADGAVAGVLVTVIETTARHLADAALRESEARFRAYVTASADVVYRMGPDWSEMRALDGRGFLADTRAPTRGWLDTYIHPDDQALVRAAIGAAIRARAPFELEHRVRRADGSLGWTLSRAVPILDGRGEITEWLGAAKDVTARAEADAALRASEERGAFLLSLSDALRPLTGPEEVKAVAARLLGEHLGVDRAAYAELLPDGEHMVTADGYLRPGVTSIAGTYRAVEFGEFFRDIERGETATVADALTDPSVPEGTYESTFGLLGLRAAIAHPVMKDGRLVAALYVHSLPPRQWSGAEVSLVAEVGERTWEAVERARIEAALRDSEERFRLTVEGALDYAIFTLDPEGRIRDWPPGAASIFGWAADEAVGRDGAILYTPEDRERGVPGHELATARAEGVAPDIRWHLRRDGPRVFIEGSVRAMRDPGGRLQGYLKIGQDVTERQAAERRLRESESRFRGFAEASADVLWIVDARGERLDYVSPAFDAVYGVPRQAVMDGAVRVVDLVHPDDRAAFLSGMPRALAGEAAIVHYRVVRADGTTVHLRDTGFLIRDEAGATVQVAGIVQDVTDMELARAAVEAEGVRFRTLAEGIPQLVWRAGDDGLWTWASPQWRSCTGQSEQESRGQGWLEAIHPDDRETMMQAWHAAREHGSFDVECRVRRVADGAWRWHQARSVPVRNGPTVDRPGGHVVEWLGTMTDIEDLKRLQGQQEMLVAELQHRTRNLLGVVRMVARKSIPPSPGRDEYDARLAALSRVQGFLSRGGSYAVPLRELVEAELRAAGDGAPPRVVVDGPPVELPGEGVQPVSLALHELATNAVKYGALAEANPGGRLSVTWRVEQRVDGPRLLLAWRESRVAMPPGLPERYGYGSELITRALPYQLKAETRLEFTPDGVRCDLTLPSGAFRAVEVAA
ncbi:MAG: hypothetical protein DI601_02425 [Azospirillum brasilense]|nr:MAG: hypothetical protein DI601_02425 [Azospirillum brasilense]